MEAVAEFRKSKICVVGRLQGERVGLVGRISDVVVSLAGKGGENGEIFGGSCNDFMGEREGGKEEEEFPENVSLRCSV